MPNLCLCANFALSFGFVGHFERIPSSRFCVLVWRPGLEDSFWATSAAAAAYQFCRPVGDSSAESAAVVAANA